MKRKSKQIRNTNSLFRNRKAQFFLIAALVIIAIILGLASIQIASKMSKENIVIFNLANEIDLEGKSVVDHGIFNGLTDEQLKCKLVGKKVVLTNCDEDGILNYYIQAYPDKEIVVVYGDTGGYNVVRGEEVSLGPINLGEGGATQPITQIQVKVEPIQICNVFPCPVRLEDDEGNVLVETEIREQGQTFYAVIAGTTEEGEKTVATSNTEKPLL